MPLGSVSGYVSNRDQTALRGGSPNIFKLIIFKSVHSYYRLLVAVPLSLLMESLNRILGPLGTNADVEIVYRPFLMCPKNASHNCIQLFH